MREQAVPPERQDVGTDAQGEVTWEWLPGRVSSAFTLKNNTLDCMYPVYLPDLQSSGFHLHADRKDRGKEKLFFPLLILKMGFG